VNYPNYDVVSVEDAAAFVLQSQTGLDIDSEHGRDTPRRYLQALKDMTAHQEFNFTTFPNDEKVDEMVLVSPIRFVSLCTHHILPFMGVAHVAYLPANTLCGISKLPRLVKGFAKGLWIQEHLTNQIADELVERLDPVGVAVVMKAEHMCMSLRGVEEYQALTTTSAMRGAFLDPQKGARAEFLSLIRE
jgi:GTP cyclohydrolase I